MLHIAQIGFFLDPQERLPQQLLQDWWPLARTAEGVVRSGMRVSVVQACCRTEEMTRSGVTYHFLAPELGQPTMTRGAAFARLIQQLEADVFHVHGLGFSQDVLALARIAPGTPIFVQDHAGGVPSLWRRRKWRHSLAAVAGVSFCTPEQAQPFAAAALLGPRTAVYTIPECTTQFAPTDRPEARRTTGIAADPAVLWVGHLDPNKDPLTVLAGISAAVDRLPDLQLWCCFGTAPLMDEVRARIDSDSRLRGRVHLLGRVAHDRMEQLMSAADVFVLGSQREVMGCSVLEALACGLPPVITDIPSYRMLTDGGRIGALWPRGDGRALADALVSVATRPSAPTRAAVRAHFETYLSLEAVGEKLAAAYRDVLGRTGGTVAAVTSA